MFNFFYYFHYYIYLLKFKLIKDSELIILKYIKKDESLKTIQNTLFIQFLYCFGIKW